MKKFGLMIVLFCIACVFAGLYGVLHNQISYTVSEEYFTKYKFYQFQIYAVPPRIGAAIVGWKAAWWMGIVIGIVLIPVGLFIQGNQNYFWSMIRVFAIVTVTTFTFGLVALALAYLSIDPDSVKQFTRYNTEIVNDVAFARAGTMHNFSYLGGLVGIIVGSVYINRICWKQRQHMQNSESPKQHAFKDLVNSRSREPRKRTG